jgi:hypothetical protein
MAIMDDRQKILERLRKKEQEIEGLEERLRTARTYVQALNDILKLLTDEDLSDGTSTQKTGLRAGSAVDQARQLILKNGSAVHISVLAAAIGQDTKEGRISLASSLAAYVRKEEIFTRPAPNTFGLVELGHKTVAEETDGPPAGFGQTRPAAQAARQPPNPNAMPSFGRSTPGETPPATPRPVPKVHEPAPNSDGPIDDDIPF